jgi:DnaJ domain
MSSDLYSVLELSRHASGDAIKAAYWARVKRSHPDVNAGDAESERQTKEIIRAYEILGDPEQRAAYDLERALVRAKAWRRARSAAATCAAMFVITVSSVLAVAMWSHDPSVGQQVQTSEPADLAGNESRGAEAPAAIASAKPADREASDGAGSLAGEMPSEPVAPRIVESPVLLPGQAASASTTDGVERIAMASQPSADQGVSVAPAPEFDAAAASVPLPAALDASQPVDPAQAAPAFQPDVRKNRRAASQAKPGQQSLVTEPKTAAREPRLISRTATALRWPSADEPFVNVGAKHR